jgi:hypothetical protein
MLTFRSDDKSQISYNISISVSNFGNRFCTAQTGTMLAVVDSFPTARKTRAADEPASTGHDESAAHHDESAAHHDETAGHHEEILFSKVETAGMLFHYTLLYALNDNLLIGVEFLSFYDVGGRFSYVTVFPQIHAISIIEVQVEML